MNTYKRFGNRWTINECLQLQREFELLQLPINDIALRHQRTANAIMLKLHSEGFADYTELYTQYSNHIHLIPVDNFHHDEELHLQEDEEDEEVDQDDSSDYNEEEQEDDDDEYDEEDDNDTEHLTLRQQVQRLSSQVAYLIELVSKSEKEKKKSIYSFFG
jgi:hypothetical protein